MRFSYVLPDPRSYAKWADLEADLACLRQAGYDAVELQIANPADFDDDRVRRSLAAVDYEMCALQTGGSYATCGNCLCTPDAAVRERTIRLLKSFVELAARWNSVIVFGSLQGRRTDEGDRIAGSRRIVDALAEVGQYATEKGATIAFEPITHEEVGFHNTIAEVADVVRQLALPGLRMMVDTFHMNIEERDMIAPLAGVADILAHVHLSETNRGVLGEGHWPTGAFLAELKRIGYRGVCSVGVYNTRRPRRECILRCGDYLKKAQL
jgi:sugar phosphate isomerase/epimerase